jgi:hypothetical protein
MAGRLKRRSSYGRRESMGPLLPDSEVNPSSPVLAALAGPAQLRAYILGIHGDWCRGPQVEVL